MPWSPNRVLARPKTAAGAAEGLFCGGDRGRNGGVARVDAYGTGGFGGGGGALPQGMEKCIGPLANSDIAELPTVT